MAQQEIKDRLLSQIECYIEHKITKEEYYDIAEPFFSEYAVHIKNSDFYRIFINNIPDICIINIDEPGGREEEKEKEFRSVIEETFLKLKYL